MFDLIAFPFKLAWQLVCVAFNIVVGMIEFAFGLLGGLLELIISIAVIVLVVSFIRLAVSRRRAERTQQEDFTSFYSQDGKVE